ncbi:MAG: Ig domain-containing protein [Clostridia bacterium]|nr:Ig domain-containing protein [Clostridia bacterium]
MKRYMAAAVVIVLLLCLVGCAKVTDTPKDGKSTAKTTASTVTTVVSTVTTVTTVADGEVLNPTTTVDGVTATTTTQPTATPTEPVSKDCTHPNVKEATCDTPSVCADCNKTMGEALGHNFVDKSCTRCGRKNPNYVPRVEVIGVKLNETELNMLIGETVTLVAALNPVNATDKAVTWKSSNPSIATVSEDGKITAVAIGEATITASSVNGKTATCKVSVQDMVVEMPTFPLELFYNAQHNDVAIYMMLEGVDYIFTQTAADKGTLLFLFDGWLSYAGDGHGGYTYPNFGWRLYDSNNALVTEGIAQSDESLAIGSDIAGLTVEVPSLSMGKYRLELYSTYVRKK